MSPYAIHATRDKSDNKLYCFKEKGTTKLPLKHASFEKPFFPATLAAIFAACEELAQGPAGAGAGRLPTAREVSAATGAAEVA
jgi:hypothetical protein